MTDKATLAHEALKEIEVLLASEMPNYQIMPVVRAAITAIEAVVEVEAAAEKTKVASTVKTRAKKVEKAVEAEVEKVVDEVEKVVGVVPAETAK